MSIPDRPGRRARFASIARLHAAATRLRLARRRYRPRAIRRRRAFVLVHLGRA